MRHLESAVGRRAMGHVELRARSSRRPWRSLLRAMRLLSIALALLAGGPAHSDAPDGRRDWPAYGRDAGATRYAPLTQIDRASVTRLQVAWTYRTGEANDQSPMRRKAAFEATPLLVDDTLYLSTPFSRVIALDPARGTERWVSDPGIDRSRSYSEVTSRGVSAWLDPVATSGAPCRRRIFSATLDARLIALDGVSGAPCRDFGQGGQVDLTRDVRLAERGNYQVTSPPAILGELVVVGSSIGDNRGVEVERGVVRAFDTRSGHLRWSWDPIPRRASDPANLTWLAGSAERTGAANAWAPISADPGRGLVFVPTSSPSPDYYGGERRGANLYANSVVALRATTGEVAWHFQVVHHDLWDYDVASQPTLLTVTRDGLQIPAVVVGTKMGHLFVLHRDTGQPIFPVEERAVPASHVPGELASPTQPFPLRPAPLVPQRLMWADAWGLTPADRDACRARLAALRSDGIFTPPSLEGSVHFPGNAGGMHWGGMAHDPARGLVIVNTNRLATLVRLIPRADYDQERAAGIANRLRGEFGRQAGTPFAMYREPLLSPSGLPCNPPPWGTLAAVDLVRGEVRWEVPLGIVPQLASIPEASAWGAINLGGPIATAGGLIFVAAAMDPALRAFDVETGKLLWRGELPASAQATPMTYQLGPNGKQFIVIAAGGHGKLGTKMGDHVVAFALP
jgi:quinoprotein glucose dehydrogenase